MPSSELALPVLKHSGVGDTRDLSVAVQAKKVGESSMEELSQALRLIMLKLGIRSNNLPSQEEKMVLIEHICNRYGTHALEEIKLAFDMAMIGKLDGEFRCYENFSCDYVSHVMKAYRKWAKEEYKQIPQLPPIPAKKENLSDFSMLRWLAQEIRFIRTGKPFELVPLELYDYLDKRGKIPATNEEKFEYMRKAAAWRAGQLQKDAERKSSVDNLRSLEKFRTMRQNDNFSADEFEKLKAIAKKLVFFDLAMKTDR